MVPGDLSKREHTWLGPGGEHRLERGQVWADHVVAADLALVAAPAPYHLHPLPYLVGEELRQRGEGGFDPRQIDIAVEVALTGWSVCVAFPVRFFCSVSVRE